MRSDLIPHLSNLTYMLRKTKIIIILLIISLLVILSLPVASTQNIKVRIADFLSPLIKGTHGIFNKLLSVRDYFSAVKENRNLREKEKELFDRCNVLRECFLENQRLTQLLDLKKALPYESIACRVIARDAGSWYKTLIIDKGKSSGIDVDMPVINRGLVGRIMSCGQDTSRVLLITDINSSVGGMIQETRAVGLVEGDGVKGCVFNLISRKEEPEAGSVVVTSGFSRVFPKGLVIGKITDVSGGSHGLYKTAKIELSADIDRLEEVLVLIWIIHGNRE